MDFLKKGFASASKIVGSASGMMGLGEKTDKSLEDAQNKLRSLERMLARMRKSMLTLQKTGNNFGAADMLVTRVGEYLGVGFGVDIGVFYKASKVRQKSITDYAYVHEELQKVREKANPDIIIFFEDSGLSTSGFIWYLSLVYYAKPSILIICRLIFSPRPQNLTCSAQSKGDLVKMKKQCQKLAREDRYPTKP
eukprot:1208332-Amorphochlora_amoeboformis.AAC.2